MSIIYSHELPTPSSYAALFETTGWNQDYQASEQELHQAITGSWQLLCAYDQGQLVGFGRVVSDGVLYAMIYDLIVHPDYQGQGVGSQLLTQLLELCRLAEIRAVQLFSARGKVGFYQKRGFVVRPEDAPGMVFSSGDCTDKVKGHRSCPAKLPG